MKKFVTFLLSTDSLILTTTVNLLFTNNGDAKFYL